MNVTQDLGSSNRPLSHALPQLQPFNQPECKCRAKNGSENLSTELSLWGQCHAAMPEGLNVLRVSLCKSPQLPDRPKVMFSVAQSIVMQLQGDNLRVSSRS